MSTGGSGRTHTGARCRPVGVRSELDLENSLSFLSNRPPLGRANLVATQQRNRWSMNKYLMLIVGILFSVSLTSPVVGDSPGEGVQEGGGRSAPANCSRWEEDQRAGQELSFQMRICMASSTESERNECNRQAQENYASQMRANNECERK